MRKYMPFGLLLIVIFVSLACTGPFNRGTPVVAPTQGKQPTMPSLPTLPVTAPTLPLAAPTLPQTAPHPACVANLTPSPTFQTGSHGCRDYGADRSCYRGRNSGTYGEAHHRPIRTGHSKICKAG